MISALKAEYFRLLNKEKPCSYFCGFDNPSNHCYLHSFLQIIFKIPEVQEILEGYNDPKPDSNDDGETTEEALAWVYQKIKAESKNAESIDVHNQISQWRIGHELLGTGQQDIADFISRITENKIGENLEKIFKVHGEFIQENRTVHFGSCVLSIGTRSTNVTEGITETITALDMNEFRYTNIPKYVFIHINRLESNFDDPVSLFKYCYIGDKIFRLKAFVIHTGNTKSGHFYSVIIESNQVFIKYNSKHVSILNIEDIHKNLQFWEKNICLLFFEQTDCFSPNENVSSKYEYSSSITGIQISREAPHPPFIPPIETNDENSYTKARHPYFDGILHYEYQEIMLDLSIAKGQINFARKTQNESNNLNITSFLRILNSTIRLKQFSVSDYGILNSKSIISTLTSEVTEDLEVQALSQSLLKYYYNTILYPNLISKQNLLHYLENELGFEFEFEDDTDEENYYKNFFTISNYKWEDRAEILDSERIIEIISEKRKSKTSYCSKYDIVRQSFHNFLNEHYRNNSLILDQHNSTREICAQYQKMMQNFFPSDQHVCLGTLQKWVNKEPVSAKKPGSAEHLKKVSERTIKCLITTILDFPWWASATRCDYLNSPNGPNFQKPIKPRTVRSILQSLSITCKKAKFSPPQRNSLGYISARVVWAKLILELRSIPKNIIVFVDEAAFSLTSTNQLAASYVGISPYIAVPLQKIRASVIAMVVPGFGAIYKIVSHSVNSIIYQEFLQYAVQIVRNAVGNPHSNIIVIQDNCGIHLTKPMLQLAEQEHFDLIPTIPYSPQLNYPVEGYFSFMKSRSTLLGFNQPLSPNDALDAITRLWSQNNASFGARVSERLYSQWINILNRCTNGEPLRAEYNDSCPDYMNELRNIETERFIE